MIRLGLLGLFLGCTAPAQQVLCPLGCMAGNDYGADTADHALFLTGWVETRTDKHAIGFSLTHIWAPNSNPGQKSQAGYDSNIIAAPTASGITIPYVTAVAGNASLYVGPGITGATVQNMRQFGAGSPSVTGLGTIDNAYGLYIPDQCLPDVLNCYAIWTGTGANYFKGNSTLEGAVNFGLDLGSTNSYAAFPLPPITAYQTGSCYLFKSASRNTGPATVNVSMLGTVNITRLDGSQLQAGDIAANQMVQICYDGTQMQLMNRNQ